MSSNKRQKSEQEEVVIIYKQGVEVPKNVTKVIFDASVTEIPDGGLHQGVFTHCKQLREVELNDGLQKIGNCAFRACSSLERIRLPSTVTEIGFQAFYSCKNLGEVVLNEGLQLIGFQAFIHCTSLTIIKLPSSVTEIGAGAFYHCTNLREVVLNEGLQEIGKDAFRNCTSLTIIKVPSTVTEIGADAFDNCTNLREVVLNEGLRRIGWNAFPTCPGLAVVKFPSISKRAKKLIDIGIKEIEAKITANQHFEWRGEELLVSPEAIRSSNWKATRTHLDRVLTWVSYYELREATTTIELALWRIKIGETGAATVEERDACRGEVPGPAKEAIIQYLKVDIVEDGNESDDSSHHSGSSGEDESGDDWSDRSSEDESN